MKRLSIVIAALCLFGTTAMADVVELSGIYKVSFDNGIIVPPSESDGCDAPYVVMEGTDICIDPYIATNELGLILHDDGQLDFSFHLSYFNGHSCGMSGRAQRNDTGWQYSETMPADMGACVLDIRIEDDSIILNSPEDADCRVMYCGARGHLHDVRFPLRGRTQEVATAARLSCIGDMTGMCEKAVQQQ